MERLTPAEAVAGLKQEYQQRMQALEESLANTAAFRDIFARRKQLVRAVLAGGSAREESRRQLEALDAKEARLRSQYGVGSACLQCNDSLFARGKLCRCALQRIYEDCYGAMPLPVRETFSTANDALFDNIHKEVDGLTQWDMYRRALEVVRSYAQAFPFANKPNLVLFGATGLGKTFLLRALSNEIYNNGAAVLLISAIELDRAFMAHRLGECDLSYAKDAPFFAVDDLGCESMSRNVTVEYLTELLDYRIERGLPLAVATNLLPDQIKARYGERVFSRLLFTCVCAQVMLLGRDIRR